MSSSFQNPAYGLLMIVVARRDGPYGGNEEGFIHDDDGASPEP